MSTTSRERHIKLFEHALKIIPGVVAARERQEFDDARFLVSGIIMMAEELGIEHCVAWSIMFSAALGWLTSTINNSAEHQGKSFEEMLHEMALVSARIEPSDVG